MVAAVTRVAGDVALSLEHDRRCREDDVDVLLGEERGVDVFQHPDHVSRDELLRIPIEMPLIGVTALVFVAEHVTEVALHAERGTECRHHHECVRVRRQMDHVHVLLSATPRCERRCRSSAARSSRSTDGWGSSSRAGCRGR
jgi:hypothetical protein